jgi:ABC-type transport system substrate-binding protein
MKASPTGRFTHHVSDVPTIDKLEVVAPDTVRFTCAFPCPDLATVTLADLPIIPRHKWESVPPADAAKVEELPVGTGPYRLVAADATSGYRFEANEDYFAGAPLVKELVMPVIADVSATFTAMRTGEIDSALRAVPPELVGQLGGGITVVATKPLQFVEMRINYQRPPFEVPELRRALSLAIDRQDLLATVVLGQGRAADSGYPHPDSPWTSPRLTTPSDPAESRRLLDALGFTDRDGDGIRERPTGEALAFGAKVNGAEPTHVRAAELVAEEYKAVGIQMKVETLDAGGMLALNRTRDFDLAIGEIGAHGVADPTQFIMSHRSGYLWPGGAPPLVLHAGCDPVRHLGRELPLHEPERQVETTGHAPARDQVSVVDHSPLDDHRSSSSQVVPGAVVGCGAPAPHQSGMGQQHRPRAHRGQATGADTSLGQYRQPAAPLHLTPSPGIASRDPTAPRHEEDVGAWLIDTIGQEPEPPCAAHDRL